MDVDEFFPWLRGQVDADEQLARKAAAFPYGLPTDAPWERERILADRIGGTSRAVAVHQVMAVFGDPRRVLAFAGALREILDGFSYEAGETRALLVLAEALYSSQRGWRPEWSVRVVPGRPE